MPYNPSLDVLRVFAVTLVIAFHCAMPWAIGGWFGVDLFFVLSGFLITTLLLKERERAGRINLLAFWVRRFKRLTPPLFLVLVCYSAVAEFFWPRYSGEKVARDVIVAATYLSDYWIAFGDNPNHLGHLWSLAVEEHYYLLWPPLLLIILKAGENIRPILILMIGAATIARWGAIKADVSLDVVYYAFHNRLTGLLLGSAAAILYQPIRARPQFMFAIGLVAFIWIVPAIAWDIASLQRPLMIAEWASLAMVLACVASPNLLSATRLAPLGRYTYGMYLWHFPLSLIFSETGLEGTSLFVASLTLSLSFAAVSFHTLEAWVRRTNEPRIDPSLTARTQ